MVCFPREPLRLGQPRYCKSCAVAKRTDRLRADATARVMLEQAREFMTEHPDEWAEMIAEAEAGKELSDAEAWELIVAAREAEDEALRRMVEGET